MMTDDSIKPEDQRTTVNRLLNDEQVLVHINPHHPGVALPEHLMKNRSVTLRLSRYFRGDLTTDDDKVIAELLFGAEYFSCVIPWASIWGASSAYGEEYLWNDAAPQQVAEMISSEKRNNGAPKTETPAKRPKASTKGAHLRRVK